MASSFLCDFCLNRGKIERLLNAGKCDEVMRDKIKTRTLNSLKFEEIIEDVDKQFPQWRKKPIIIPTYNSLGKDSKLDWSEDTVLRMIKNREKQLTEHRLSQDQVSERLSTEFSEEFGFLTNLKGKRAELLVQEHLKKYELCNRAGLLVQGVNSLKHLKLFIEAYDVKTEKVVETDIIMVQAVSSKTLLITLGEVKATTEEVNLKTLHDKILKAMSQIQNDLLLFNRLFSFLRAQDWDMVQTKAKCFFPNINCPNSIYICHQCRELIMFKEDFDNSDLRNLSKPQNLEEDDPVTELFMKIVSLYLGIGNSMPSKRESDGYIRERSDLNNVSSILLSRDKKTEFLSNSDGYNLRTKGQILAGPFGSGKTLTLTLLIRTWLDRTRYFPQNTMFMLIVYKSNAEDLVNSYKEKLPQKVKVFNKPDLFKFLGISESHECTTDELNEVFRRLSIYYRNYDIHIFFDEVKVRVSDGQLLGNAPFLLRNNIIAEWSNLRPEDIKAFISVSPESVCYLESEKYEERHEEVRESNSRRHISTAFFQKVFRSNIQIQKLVKHLNANSNAGFSMSLDDAITGHEIAGGKPLWFPRKEKRHIWCTESGCSDCFFTGEILAKIFRLDEKIGVEKGDITFIFHEIGEEMNSVSRTRLSKFFSAYLKMPNVKFNREFEV